MIYSIDVEITAPVYDTELSDRVGAAIEALFPEAEIERRHGEITAEAHSLDHFSELLHRQSILDTARGVFFDTKRADGFSFALKKQAAFESVVNFAVGETDELGELNVRVRVREPTVEEFIDQIAPPTEDGQPVTTE